MTPNRELNLSKPEEVFCGTSYPKGGHLMCLKQRGHDGPHATLLGIHPEQEDGYGQMWPAQEEWDEWD